VDSADNRARLDAIIIDFVKAFDLVPHDRLLMKTAASGVELRVVVWKRGFLLGRMQRVRVGGQLSEEVKSNIRCTGEHIGSTFVSIIRTYLEEHRVNY